MKICHKYPVSFDDYRIKHEKDEKKYGTEGIECRYQKACFMYSAFKYSNDKDNREIAKSYKDLISNPIDAFDIWWDI